MQGASNASIADRNPELATNIALAQANIALLQRNYPAAIEAVRKLSDSVQTAKPHYYVETRLHEGIACEKLGKAAEARAAFLEAKTTATSAVQEAPNEASRHALLARALSYLGEKEAAVAEARRVTGENTEAVEILEGLLSRPSDITVSWLKVEPAFDGLREDPAFQKMLAKH